MKIINISKISFVVCFLIALLIVVNYERGYQVYDSVKAKTLDVLEPVLTTASSGVYAIGDFIGRIGSVFTVFKENKELKERNNFLEYYFYLYKQNEGENKELKRQLNFVENIEQKYLTGQIISRSNNHLHQEIIVNIGANNGVKKWQMVLSEHNFIGRVVDVSKNTANI